MPKTINEINNKYGKLLVVAKATEEERKAAKILTGGVCWKCVCECGNIRYVLGSRLRKNQVTECEQCQRKKKKEKIYIPKENLIGQKFNHWTVLDINKERSQKERRSYWICQCDCDNHTIQTVRGDQLKSGKSSRCGTCSFKQTILNGQNKVIDLTGQVFGRLTVLKRDINRTNDGRIKWICQCNCQNHTIVSIAGESLKSGNTRSCGCLQKEAAARTGANRLIDLTGQKFGHLTVLNKIDNQGTDTLWLCECDCDLHTKTKVLGYNLKNGHTQTCGLCKRGASLGEEKIAALLTQNKIQFFTQQTVKINNINHRFDFFVNNKYFIEYDGIGHFQATQGWNTKDAVKNRQERDEFKNQWCKENNIPLIRIPYTHLNDLKIEDLLLETSKFII